MADRAFRGRRRWRAFTRRMRELGLIVRGAVSTDHPIMAHIIPVPTLQSILLLLQ